MTTVSDVKEIITEVVEYIESSISPANVTEAEMCEYLFAKRNNPSETWTEQDQDLWDDAGCSDGLFSK